MTYDPNLTPPDPQAWSNPEPPAVPQPSEPEPVVTAQPVDETETVVPPVPPVPPVSPIVPDNSWENPVTPDNSWENPITPETPPVPPVPPTPPVSPKQPKQPKKPKKAKTGRKATMPLMLIIAVLLVLALGGGAAWFLLSREPAHPDLPPTAATADGQAAAAEGSDDGTQAQTTVTADDAGITTVEYPDDDPLGRERYVGTVANGLPQDTAAAVYYRNGDLFRGRVDAGHLAAGTLFRPDGDFFRGRFHDDQPYDGHWYNENREPIATVKEGITQK